MDQNNIDRFFREKLDGNEVLPSSKAWNEVEKQIGGKKKPVVLYWVAATISLLLISWIVWPEYKASIQGIASGEFDHPIWVKKASPGMPIAASLSPKRTSDPGKETMTLVQKNQIAKETVDIKKTVVSEEIIKKVSLEESIAKEETVPPPQEVEEIEVVPSKVEPIYSKVKITYIASNKNVGEEAKADSTGALKKLIAFTDKIDPGEMLADIKSVKDNLLSGGLKNKKHRTLMTP